MLVIGAWAVRVRLLDVVEGFRRGLRGLLQQDLDFLLGSLQRGLAGSREFDAALELSQRILERQLAVLESLDDSLEFTERLLEIDGLGFSDGHVDLRGGRARLAQGSQEGQRS